MKTSNKSKQNLIWTGPIELSTLKVSKLEFKKKQIPKNSDFDIRPTAWDF